jgi:hypothetical protein
VDVCGLDLDAVVIIRHAGVRLAHGLFACRFRAWLVRR